jgi:hypothetical protein
MMQCGRICMAPHKATPTIVFAGHNVGMKQVGNKVRLVSFMDYDLGLFERTRTSDQRMKGDLRPVCNVPALNRQNPPKTGGFVTLVSRADHLA